MLTYKNSGCRFAFVKGLYPNEDSFFAKVSQKSLSAIFLLDFCAGSPLESATYSTNIY